MVPRLRRHAGNLLGRNVRRIHEQQVDPTTDVRGQRVEEVTLEYIADPGQVATSTGHRGRLDVGRVEPDARHRRRHRGAQRPTAAAQVHHDRGGRRQSERSPNQILGATAWHKDAGIDGNSKSREFGPTQDDFERVTRDATRDAFLELGCRGRLGNE